MKFGEIPVLDACGAVLAHSVRYDGGIFKKGRLLTEADIAILQAAGVGHIFAAVLDDGDVAEDVAAAEIAQLIAGDGARIQAAFTGRANLFAGDNGLAVIDAARIHALNRIDESLTVATVPAFERVGKKQLLATVKVIPFSLTGEVLQTARQVIGDTALVSLAPFQKLRAGLVITRLLHVKDSIIDKSERAMRDRLADLGGELVDVRVSGHNITEVAAAISDLAQSAPDLILVFGASAIVDRGDVIPAACLAAGGKVVHLGMPVDPGNLLMLGALGSVPLIGVPSCARSAKLNGFDWVLQRILAGLEVMPEDIMAMGVGGLLKEIPSRPAPREGGMPVAPSIAAVILAAGTSSRFGSENKLLALFNDQPVIAQTVANVMAADVDSIRLVTGHEAEKVRRLIPENDVTVCFNADFETGMASSLKAGISGLDGKTDAAFICLGDMPLVTPDILNRLIAAFSPDDGREICIPVYQGKRGNPVLIGKRLFAEIAALEGDVGAKAIIHRHEDKVAEVAVDTPAILRDFDTPESLLSATAR